MIVTDTIDEAEKRDLSISAELVFDDICHFAQYAMNRFHKSTRGMLVGGLNFKLDNFHRSNHR